MKIGLLLKLQDGQGYQFKPFIKVILEADKKTLLVRRVLWREAQHVHLQSICVMDSCTFFGKVRVSLQDVLQLARFLTCWRGPCLHCAVTPSISIVFLLSRVELRRLHQYDVRFVHVYTLFSFLHLQQKRT